VLSNIGHGQFVKDGSAMAFYGGLKWRNFSFPLSITHVTMTKLQIISYMFSQEKCYGDLLALVSFVSPKNN